MISGQQDFLLLLADIDASTLFYIVLGLLAAISSWLTKRKEAAKRAELMPPHGDSQHTYASEGKRSDGDSWLDKLETMVEEAEERVEQTSEPDLPPVIAAPVEAAENRLQSHIENVHRKPSAPSFFQDQPIEKQLPSASARLQQSPVYQSPIYSANISNQIANDLNAARQGVVASIILNPPKALEDPEQATRY